MLDCWYSFWAKFKTTRSGYTDCADGAVTVLTKFQFRIYTASCDKRTGKIYWQYKHPVSGRFHSLGMISGSKRGLREAEHDHCEHERTGQVLKLTTPSCCQNERRTDITVTGWIDKYIDSGRTV